MAITLIGACTGWSYNGTTVYLSNSGSLNVLAGDIVVAAIQINPSSINVSSIQKNSGTATVGAFTVRTKIINGTKVGLTVGYAIVTGSGTLNLSATASSTPTTSIAGCVTYRGASGVVGGTGGTGTGTDVTLSITTTVAESWVVFAGSINTALGLASGTNCVVEATRIVDPGGTASDLTVSLGSNETPLSIQTIAAHMVGGASVVWAADILELLSASQLIVPDSDISRDSGWDTGPNPDLDLYPWLADYSNTNYVIGYVPDSSTITFEVSLSNPAGTPSGSTATVKFRAKYVGGYGLSLNIKLKEGGWDNNSLTPTLTTSYVEYSLNCTGLTNYNDLTIFVTAETSSASQVYISGIKVEVPNAGGAVLKKIIGETLQISEAIVRRKAMKRLIGETEQITEAIARRKAMNRLIGETEQITEAIARRKAMNRLIGETEQITEAIVRRKAMSRLINETIQFIESKIYVLGVAGAALLKIINETLQISEAILRRKAMKRLVGETVQIVEGILKLKTILRFIVETIQITESILRRTALVRLINETNQIAETILRRKAMSRLINEVVQIAEAVSKLKTILRFIGETVQIAETILRRKAMNRLIAETIQIAESILRRKAMNRLIAETIQIAESILRRKAMSRLINETIQFAESKIYVLGVAGAALLKIINETVQIAEASLRRKSMVRLMNETLQIVENILWFGPIIGNRNPTSDEAVAGSWDGTSDSRYAVVNDHPDSTGSTFLTHGTTAGSITFGFTPFNIPLGSTNISVMIVYYDKKAATQADNIGGRLKVGGNYYNATTHGPTNGVWTLRTDTWATNPKTSTNWTTDDINGIGVNALTAFGWVSTDANPTIQLSSIQLQITFTPPGIKKIINETIQVVEGILRRKAMKRLIGETIQITESILRRTALVRLINETNQIAETILRRKAMNRLIAETIQIAESILRRKAMSRLINETIQFIESKIYVLGVVGAALLKIINETVQIAEASLRRKSMTRIINEAVSVVESVLRRVALVRIINETEYIIEALLRRSSLKRILNEGIAIGEGVIRLKTMIRILNEAIEIAETILTRHGLVRWINETIEITEEILKFRGFVIIINETIQIIENTTSILNYITILARKIFYAVERLREFISRHPRVFQSDERQSDLDARSRRDQFQSTKREEFKKKL